MPAPADIEWAAGKTKVLIISGGTSHDFAQFFGGTDGATLQATGFSVNYTENSDQAAAELAHADVALISVNRRTFDTPTYRAALFEFARAGKGLVMLHSGMWFGSYYTEWPELYATIVGGGARGHDAPGPPFSVNVLQPEHPVMNGVPASFEVVDELYYINAEGMNPPGTAPIDVLAETSPSLRYKTPHPSVWITSHPTARIVGIAIGHDQRTHDHPAFKTLLVNAIRWAARLP
jgi:type 1 glutamine amidotransferase